MPKPTTPPPSPPLTVLVILKPARGRSVTAASATAEHVGSLVPSAAAAERLTDYFRESGCTVGPLVGISFSLTVPADDVPSILGDEVGDTFPHASVPSRLRKHVEAIVREQPIDFGPVSFG